METIKSFSCLLYESLRFLHLATTFHVCVQQIEKDIYRN